MFSFRLLDFFHQLQTQNKTNLYDFYNAIVRLSDSAGLSPEIVRRFFIGLSYNSNIYNQHRYNEISLVFRMWIHLHLLKRGGGGHQTSSIESLADGSIAVECPACPHPDRNVTIDMLDDE
jgi:hypothetical protein